MVGHHILEFLVQQEEFIDGDSSAVSCVIAFEASFSFPGLDLLGSDSAGFGDFRTYTAGNGVILHFAVRADATHQTLGATMTGYSPALSRKRSSPSTS